MRPFSFPPPSLLASLGAAQAQDAAAGEKVFPQCKACHQIGENAKNAVGPVLNGLIGRQSGSVEGYSYSAANKNSGITWDEATFREYIKDPKAKMPGTKMIFAGLKDEKRSTTSSPTSSSSTPAARRSDPRGSIPKCETRVATGPDRSSSAAAWATLAAHLAGRRPQFVLQSQERPDREPTAQRPRVGLFVTCLVDLIRPSVGFAAVKLLEDAGCLVEVPAPRPAAASRPTIPATAPRARTWRAQRRCLPAASTTSCALGVLRRANQATIPTVRRRPELAPAGPKPWRPRPTSSSSFLVDVLGVESVDARSTATVTYHDSCSGLRELGVKAQPRSSSPA